MMSNQLLWNFESLGPKAVERIEITGAAETGAKVNLSIRPEQIIPGNGKPRGRVSLGVLQVEEVSFFGTHHRCQGRHLESNLPAACISC